MVLHPETGSDSPIGSDQETWRDSNLVLISRISLSDIEIDYLRAKNSHLGVYFIDIQ